MIAVRRLGPQIGAEVTGVDVRTLDDAGFASIYRAWLDHNVAVVPGQELELDDFVTYSRRFGQVVPHPSKMTRHPERPEVTLLGVNKQFVGELVQSKKDPSKFYYNITAVLKLAPGMKPLPVIDPQRPQGQTQAAASAPAPAAPISDDDIPF